MTTVLISLKLADESVLQSSEKFFRWFCAAITRFLGLPVRLNDAWDEQLGHSFNCTSYFQNHLLSELSGPLVLALDDVDILLSKPNIAIDFFNMLKAWHEMAKYGDDRAEVWQSLRLLLVYASQAYLSELFLELPLNLGTQTNVPNFSYSQVLDLAQRYRVEEPELIADKLIHFLSGHPGLTQLTLHRLSQHGWSLEKIEGNALLPGSIFAEHLLQKLSILHQYPDVLESFKQVIHADQPMRLPPLQTFKLCSLGLIDCHNQKVVPRCQLYQEYFNHVLL